jgi:hypothetical protein
MGPEPSREAPSWCGINADQRRGAYIFTALIVVLIVVAFLVKWWLA